MTIGVAELLELNKYRIKATLDGFSKAYSELFKSLPRAFKETLSIKKGQNKVDSNMGSYSVTIHLPLIIIKWIYSDDFLRKNTFFPNVLTT